MAAPTTATVKFLTETLNKKLKTSKKGVTLDLGGGKQINGLTCIAKYLLRTSEEFKGLSVEDRMAVEQWLEYKLFIDNVQENDKEAQKLVLQELNRYLEDKVFFVHNQLTVADVLLYHSLHTVLGKLTFQEKEKYVNVSRWFSNVQQDKRTRQDLAPLNFLRTPVYDGVSSH